MPSRQTGLPFEAATKLGTFKIKAGGEVDERFIHDDPPK
jgi:hypothetical protein